MAEHICGQCGEAFKTEKKYLDHTCDKTGFTPKDFEHAAATNEGFEQASQAAQERGNKRAELEEEGVDAEEAKEKTTDIGAEVR